MLEEVGASAVMAMHSSAFREFARQPNMLAAMSRYPNFFAQMAANGRATTAQRLLSLNNTEGGIGVSRTDAPS